MNLAFREQEEKSSLLAFGRLHFQDHRLYRWSAFTKAL